jgi:hypothetical protein
MASHISEMKGSDVEQVEKVGVLQLNQAPAPQHYEPITEEEKALDRKINFKLDFLVTSILSIGFILCGSKSSFIYIYAQTIKREEQNTNG